MGSSQIFQIHQKYLFIEFNDPSSKMFPISNFNEQNIPQYLKKLINLINSLKISLIAYKKHDKLSFYFTKNVHCDKVPFLTTPAWNIYFLDKLNC